MYRAPQNRIRQLPSDVAAYLQSLSNEELQRTYHTALNYSANMPFLRRYLRTELARRNIRDGRWTSNASHERQS
ncbi:MAG: hypothetical protein NZM35_10210 [Chitinophagales bacterium]|nr:hypothetical protein [Chitinophagales bacterium]MDW8419924.1 hypothetical protein [Chitinophagales bacterium]